MADNEFEARQERNERIKNAEYQLEEEQMQARARREKEKKKMDRARANEKKKEAEQRKLIEQQRKQAEAKQLEDKKQKDEARAIMEQQRKSKEQMKTAKKNSATGWSRKTASVARGSAVSKNVQVERTSITKTEIPTTTTATSFEELARDSVETDIYVDGNRVTESELTSDLIKKIRREQGRAIAQTEDELKSVVEKSPESIFLMHVNALRKYLI